MAKKKVNALMAMPMEGSRAEEAMDRKTWTKEKKREADEKHKPMRKK